MIHDAMYKEKLTALRAHDSLDKCGVDKPTQPDNCGRIPLHFEPFYGAG